MLLTQEVVCHFVAKKKEIGNLRIEETKQHKQYKQTKTSLQTTFKVFFDKILVLVEMLH